MVKKLKKQIPPFIATGVTLGAGSAIIGRMGGSTAAGVQGGLNTVSGFMPVVGTGLGAAAVVRTLDVIKPEKQKKRRRF